MIYFHWIYLLLYVVITVPAIITVFGSCVLRLIWISTACRQVHEFWMLMIIYPISWVVTGTAMIIAYVRMERKEKHTV